MCCFCSVLCPGHSEAVVTGRDIFLEGQPQNGAHTGRMAWGGAMSPGCKVQAVDAFVLPRAHAVVVGCTHCFTQTDRKPAGARPTFCSRKQLQLRSHTCVCGGVAGVQSVPVSGERADLPMYRLEGDVLEYKGLCSGHCCCTAVHYSYEAGSFQHTPTYISSGSLPCCVFVDGTG